MLVLVLADNEVIIHMKYPCGRTAQKRMNVIWIFRMADENQIKYI